MKAVLFDMDGVLVDVSASYRAVIKKTVEYFGNENISFEKIQDYKDRGGLNNDWDCTEQILLDRGIHINKNLIIEKFQDCYLGHNYNGLIQNETWLLEKKILEQIVQRHKAGIVTGRPREEAVYVLDYFAMKKYFSTVITMNDVPADKGKPDPAGILLALQRVDAKTGWYLGDTIDDVTAAISADIVPVGVLCGTDEKQRKKQKKILVQHGAKCVLEHVNEIKEVVL